MQWSRFRSTAEQDIRRSSRDGAVDLQENEKFGATASGLLHLYDEWIWIDALCINQLDLTERNFQVSFINSIYKNVSFVLVWLREEGITTEAELLLLRNLAAVSDKLEQATSFHTDRKLTRSSLKCRLRLSRRLNGTDWRRSSLNNGTNAHEYSK